MTSYPTERTDTGAYDEQHYTPSGLSAEQLERLGAAMLAHAQEVAR